jgi:hypothetical protein
MTGREWLRIRGTEFLAAASTAGLLMGGLAAGVPFLRARIPQVFLYSFCCLAAVVLRSLIDLAVRGVLRLSRAIRPAHAPAATLAGGTGTA